MSPEVSLPRQWVPANPKVRFGVLVAAVSAAGALLFAFDPARSGLFAPCPFHALTGFHCPGCGSLRALYCLLHGDVVAAVGLNPLMVAAIPYLVYEFVSYGKAVFGSGPLPKLFRSAFSIWCLLGVIMVYWILRNVPAYPFTMLAP